MSIKITDKEQRKKVYFKRKHGFLKKAMEISMKCEQHLYFAMVDKHDGKFVEFNSSPDFNVETIR